HPRRLRAPFSFAEPATYETKHPARRNSSETARLYSLTIEKAPGAGVERAMTKTLMITLAAALLSSMISVSAFAQSNDNVQVASAAPVVRVDDVAAAKALRAFIAAQRPVAPIAAADMNGPRR
ncbi:MAG: hypothetical protein NTV97_27050, partial [Alphaproteobacteria bacterium]|nr:hypothetical protein [Alphaproteobacteria bacterium]